MSLSFIHAIGFEAMVSFKGFILKVGFETVNWVVTRTST
jgi:hypothetical protein